MFDWSSGLEEADDSQLYFSPDQGTVQVQSYNWRRDVLSFEDEPGVGCRYSPPPPFPPYLADMSSNV